MSEELCLRFLFYIFVFILCQKTGNFLFIFWNILYLDSKENKKGPITKI